MTSPKGVVVGVVVRKVTKKHKMCYPSVTLGSLSILVGGNVTGWKLNENSEL